MEYLSDRLKDSFEEWTNGTCEFIDAETGCGKTTYILDYVLPFMTKNGKRILYLVNRKILKQQIEKELERKDSVQLSCIEIMTYQALETQIIENQLETFENNQKIHNMDKYMEFDCVICDECHYFLSDSTYNTNTYLSFIWIIENFYNRIRVYMSATIAEVELLVRRYNQNYYEKRTNIYRLNRNSMQELLDINECERRRVECRLKRNYGYLHIEKIDDTDDIYDLIKKGENEKWLIFVNNISEAKKLKNGITLSIFGKKNDVGRIDAKGDDDMVQIVDEISRDRTFSKKILIATSVLDNGVSLCDSTLKNVVIIADNEVEFIQMLGRIRRDSDEDKKNLYICSQETQLFSNRYDSTIKVKNYMDELYTNFLNGAIEVIANSYMDTGNSLQDSIRLPWNAERSGYSVTATGNANFMRDRQKIMGHITANFNEETMNINLHYRIMCDLRKGKVDFDTIRKSCLIIKAQFWINRISYEQIKLLAEYYYRMKEEMKKDPYAFLKEQMRWLNREADTGDVIKNDIARSKEVLEVAIKKYLENQKDTVLTNETLIQIKKDYKEAAKNHEKGQSTKENDGASIDYSKKFLVFVNNLEEGELKRRLNGAVRKSDRVITVRDFNEVAEIFELTYRMENKKGGRIFVKVNE